MTSNCLTFLKPNKTPINSSKLRSKVPVINSLLCNGGGVLLCQDFSFEDIFCHVCVSFFLRDLLLLLPSLSDMLFLQGSEVIFKVALSLLGSHKPLILQHESLESIVDFIKTMLPKLGLVQMEKTINQVR